MTAGRRHDQIVIQRGTPVDDGYTTNLDWTNPTTVATEWAAVFYGRGDERRQAAMEQGQQAATFQVPSHAVTQSVTLKDRISHGGTWDIVGIAPDTPKVGEIEFTAVRAL